MESDGFYYYIIVVKEETIVKPCTCSPLDDFTERNSISKSSQMQAEGEKDVEGKEWEELSYLFFPVKISRFTSLVYFSLHIEFQKI